jgi:multidrug efflux system membrane fusion protein
MDGDGMAPAEALIQDRALHDRGAVGRATTRRPKTVLWFVIMGLLLAVVLGGLYGFNRFREHAITTFFANNKPPPAQISAVEVKTEAVPRFAPAIGSLAAVHQVTINPEIGGRVVKIFFEPGTTVKAGEPLVQLNDAPEQGDLKNYEAQARWAQISLERARTLSKKNFASQETVDQDQSQLDQAQAQILKTQALIAQKLIRAPFAGKLGMRQIEVGQYLTPGAPIVTLTNLSTLYVNFTLPGRQRPEIKVGQQVEVGADAFPGRVFDAKITTIEPQISADTRTMQVQATMQNPDDALLPGMFVDAKVVLPPQPDMLVLPATAVEYTLYGDSVFVIREEGKDANGEPILKAERTPVKTGARWGHNVAILDGLKPGERVVSAGQVKVQNGAQVKIGNSAPAPPANPTLN